MVTSPPMVTPPDLLTAAEVSDYFRVSPSTVARWRRTHVLTGYKVGGTLRFRRSDVEALLSPEPEREGAKP